MATAGRILFGSCCCLAGVILAALVVPSARTPRLVAPPSIERFAAPPPVEPPTPVVPKPARKVEVLILGDGYVEADTHARFESDVERCQRALLDAEPIVRFKERFRVRSAVVASKESGCDAASDEDRVDTALDCRFDEHDGRGLRIHGTERFFALVREAVPVDVVLVLVNTTRHGGSATTLIDRGGRRVKVGVFSATYRGLTRTVIHEFGHCFARLADEYSDEKIRNAIELPRCASAGVDAANVMLWRLVDETSFESIAATVKWRHFLALPGASRRQWVHRGGMYHETGVVRPWANCRMRSSEEDSFCPVCDEEIAKAIVACLGEPWDDAEWHRQRPLSDWK